MTARDAHAPEELLVLAPTGRDAELAASVLRDAGLSPRVCAHVAEACAAIARGTGALLVAEEVLTRDAVAALAAAIAGQEPWSDLPVVLLGARGGLLERRGGAAVALEPLGNVTVVDRPLRRITLVAVARAALRARRRQYAAREVLGRVQAAVRQRDEFLALLGHELRNPLAATEMALHLIERGADPARHLAVVQRQTRQLARIVDDLLEVSRVTAGKIVLRPAPVELQALADRVVETAAAGAGVHQRVEVSRAPGREPLFVVGDEARLEQVLSNLVSNAVKYTPEGGHVAVAVARDGADAVLSVADDGIGIAADDLARIFEPFVQVGSALDRARGGMGLGLTLVRGLVELHRGTVEARSDGPGRGSSFVVRVPAAEAPRAERATRPPAASCRAVLVVEDNEDVRAAFAEALALAGHQVDSAADGPTGIALALDRHPEVAFVDIGLPGVDGYEVARRLRGELGPGVLLVALTGYGRAEDRDRARAAGFDLHVVKPVDLARIQAILADGLRG